MESRFQESEEGRIKEMGILVEVTNEEQRQASDFADRWIINVMGAAYLFVKLYERRIIYGKR